MSNFEIQPGIFFKPLGLEQKVTFSKIQKKVSKREKNQVSSEQIFSLWSNTEKAWDLYIYSNLQNKGELLSIAPGIMVQVFWSSKELPRFTMKGEKKPLEFQAGPAKIQISMENKKAKKPKEKVEDSSDLCLFTSDLIPHLLDQEKKAQQKKELQKNPRLILKAKEKKARRSTDNVFFLSKMEELLTEKKQKVFISLRGIGQRVFLSEDKKSLNFKLGQTHPVNLLIPDGITAISSTDRSATVGGGDHQFLTLLSSNKEAVTQQANLLIKLRPPEPQKGKGLLLRTKKEDQRRQALRKLSKRKAG